MVVRYNQRWEAMDKSVISLQGLFESYALFNRSEGKAASTISWYDDKLRGFLRWLEANEYSADLGEFKVDRVPEFALHLQDKEEKFERNPFVPTRREKLSGQTIRGYVRTLKAFATWLFEEEYAETNILRRYRLPKARRPEPEWLRHDEIERLLTVFDRKTTVGARDYAIVITLLDTGLRCAELCNLALANADLETGELKVIGKGNKGAHGAGRSARGEDPAAVP